MLNDQVLAELCKEATISGELDDQERFCLDERQQERERREREQHQHRHQERLRALVRAEREELAERAS